MEKSCHTKFISPKMYRKRSTISTLLKMYEIMFSIVKNKINEKRSDAGLKFLLTKLLTTSGGSLDC